MTRDEFKLFTQGFLSDLISWAEVYLRTKLPRENIELVAHQKVLAIGKENVVNFLLENVYLAENKIIPCVDLIVQDFDSTTVTIRYLPSGYNGGEFGINWNGAAGPYIKMIGMRLVEERSNKDFPPEWANGT